MNKKLYVSLLAIALSLASMSVEARMTKEAHALYQEACNYEYKGDYVNAISTIQKALNMNGDDAMLYTKIAGLYADAGNYEEALGAYKKAVKLRPNDAFIYISIGNILQTMGDYENAYNSYMQAQQIYPEYKYNYLNIANIEYIRKNYKNAIDNYTVFLNAYPEHLEASENLANVYYASGQPDKACDLYSLLYKKYPSAFKDYTHYGMALYDTKQYKAASEVLTKALEDNNDDEAILAKLALSYQNLGENDKAFDYFQKTFAINPELTALRFDYANLLGNMDKDNDAIEEYKIYIKAFPNDANAYKNLGLVYKKQNEMDLALFNIEKAYTLDSSDNEIKKELGLCYHQKLDYINALKFYNMALATEPDNYELLANKALTLHAMNNYVAAIELYKQLLEKKPNDRLQSNLASATIAYAYDLYDKKDYGQAILYFEDAIELNPKEASAYFGYAQANDKMGCYDVALENYRKAVSLAPSNLDYNTTLGMFMTNHKMAEAKAAAEVMNKNIETVVNKPIAENQKITLTTTEQTMAYESLVKNGDDAYKKQQYNEALDYYTKAVVYAPQDKLTMLKIANIYKLTGNNTKALSFYDRLLSLDKNNADAYFNKGLVLANQKNYDDAIKCFERVIQLTPEYPYAYYSLGMSYEQQGDTEKALEYYELYLGLEKDEKMVNTVKQKISALGGK